MRMSHSVNAHRWAALITVAALWGAAASAAAQASPPRVALWPLAAESVPEDVAYQAQAALRKEMEGMLGARLINADEVEAVRATPEGAQAMECRSQVSCAADLGHRVGADLSVLGGVRPQGAATAMELRLVDVALQREVGRVQAELPESVADRGTTLREMVARLILPEKHQGSLVVNGIDATATVWVDGQSRADVVPQDGTVRVRLRVGRHDVEVRRGGKAVMSDAVDVRFEEIMVLMAPPAGEMAPVLNKTLPPDPLAPRPKNEESPVRIPFWLGPAVGALAVPPVLVAGGFLLDLLYLGPLVLTNPASCQPWLVSQNGATSLNQKASPLNTCGSFWRVTSRKEQAAAPAVAVDLGAAFILGLVALGVLATAAALLVGAFIPQE